MAATTQAALPFSGAGSQLTGDCLQCNALRSLLTQCGSCGGTTQTSGCPTGDVAPGPAGCPAGYAPDPNHQGCCAPTGQHTLQQCAFGEHPQPCAANEVIDPQTGCCATAIPGCPAGDSAPGPAGCPAGYAPDPNHQGCCVPTGQQTQQGGACPTGDTAANANGACPSGYGPDSAHPGCCMPTGPTQTAPQAVEACFVCPGGLTELSAALAGQPNGCYLASQMFFPAGSALPPPGQ